MKNSTFSDINSKFMFSGLMAGFGGGLIRTAFVDSKKKADIVPVDLVVNMMCIIGWKTSKRQVLPLTKTLISADFLRP